MKTVITFSDEQLESSSGTHRQLRIDIASALVKAATVCSEEVYTSSFMSHAMGRPIKGLNEVDDIDRVWLMRHINQTEKNTLNRYTRELGLDNE